MTKLNEINYYQLTSKERFDLTIAALARNDNAEVDRLKRTCQRKQYSMLDHEYTSKLERITFAVSKFEALHNNYYHNMILFSGYMAANEIDETYAKYLDAYNDQASCLLSLYNALDAFCTDAELNLTHVMTWFKLDPKQVYDLIGEKTLTNLQPDPGLTEHLKNRFLAIWHGDTC